MTGKRDEKRRKLKDDVLAAATARIHSGGLAQLRARDVAADVGCALGAIYNVFTDLDDLVLTVNSATLRSLGADLAAAAARHAGDTPERQMIAFAHAYLDFAMRHPHAWAALFDHRLPEGKTVPDWHYREQALLFATVIVPLRTAMPGVSEARISSIARGLFSAVHGIVSLGLQHRFAAVDEADLGDMLALLVGSFVKANSPREGADPP
ncbi:TetR/AcrR family transcriptional regulator [Ensifer soli]|uniref:TetR/AcrR family transcriptional regulator n=1 Tax=Ciceribacter sp. sgz301302 TaxID=3342379 RepID=UPI0035B933DA